MLCAAVVVGVGLLQIIPFPVSWTRYLSLSGANVRQQVSVLLPETASKVAPLSFESAATIDALLRLLAYFVIGLAAAVVISKRRHMLQAALVIATAGAFQAFYGSIEYLSGHQHIFGYAKEHALDEASGTFINRNHFAGYLAMTLPFAMGLMLDAMRRLPPAANWREGILRLSRPAGLMLTAGGLATAVIWIGVVLSHSRGGLAAALVATMVVVAATASRKKVAVILAIALLLPTLFLSWQEIRAPGERFAADPEELVSIGGRLDAWKTSAAMTADYIPLGTGLGTFASAFRLHQPSSVMKFWRHAHNDWLQSAVEGGPFVTLAFLLMLFFVLKKPREVRRFALDPVALTSCVTAAICAISFHSLVDFSLRMPAVAALTAALVGMSCFRHGNLPSERNV
jgi:O-antigen ligase